MRRRQIGRLAIAASLWIGLAGASAPASLPAGPVRYVMRHLNTPEGVRDPDLTAEGKAAASRLVAWFAGKPLGAIYVSDFRRTRQTAGPLAEARNLAVTVYDPGDTPALVARLRAEKREVLVIGHSNTVPDIVEQLGGARPAPLAHADFRDIWTVTDGTARREKLAATLP